jgi:integration host factor subunit beta
MTKLELIFDLATKADINSYTAEAIVCELFGTMADALVAGDGIEIRGFGSFTIRENVGRVARNPKTGAEVKVLPKKRPFFKAGKELKEQLLNSTVQIEEIL